MTILKFILKKILYPASAIFTSLWLLVCGVIDAVMESVNINFASGLMCFGISLAIACSNLILTQNAMAKILRYFLHLLSSVISISLIVALFSSTFHYVITGNSFYLVLILIVVYVIIATPLILLYFKKSKIPDKKSEYQPMFKK